MREFFFNVGVAEIFNAVFCDDHKIGGLLKERPVMTKDLSSPTFDAVPRDSPTDLPRDRDSQAGSSRRRSAKVIDEALPIAAVAAPLEPEEVPSSLDAASGTKPSTLLVGVCHGSRLNYLIGVETERRFRPLRRRAMSTFLPPGLAERERNPCLFFRLLLLGW